MRLPVLLGAVALLAASSAEAKPKFNWDALGTEFCRLTQTGDLAGMRDILSDRLIQDITAASANPELPAARILFQSYSNELPECAAETRNAAVVAITRSNSGGTPPSWTEYLVLVPQADGTTRIDDVLFATRRSDTLRTRLESYYKQR